MKRLERAVAVHRACGGHCSRRGDAGKPLFYEGTVHGQCWALQYLITRVAYGVTKLAATSYLPCLPSELMCISRFTITPQNSNYFMYVVEYRPNIPDV